MRIAMVASSDAYWTPLYVRHFSSAGHEVRVFSLAATPLAAADVDLVHVCGPRPRLIPAAGWFLAQVPRLRRLLRRFAPDVVFAPYMSSNGVAAALAWRGPLVVSGHGGDVLRQAGYLPGGPLHRHMMRFQCRRAATVHVVADELVDALTAYGVPRERIVCFPLGVEVGQFPASSHVREASTAHIVCTRRQEAVYANDVLVDALALLRDRGCSARCTFVGGGPLLAERRAQVERLGLGDEVTFTGQVPMATVESLLRSAHVYVSASTSDGTSSSLLEAMLCGPFPVVSRIRANMPWINDGITGLFFDPGDAVALAGALERAIRSPEMRRAASSLNRARVIRDGSLERSMADTLALLERASSARGERAAQGIFRRIRTSKSGPVVAGMETARPTATGGRTGSIGISTAPPS